MAGKNPSGYVQTSGNKMPRGGPSMSGALGKIMVQKKGTSPAPPRADAKKMIESTMGGPKNAKNYKQVC